MHTHIKHMPKLYRQYYDNKCLVLSCLVLHSRNNLHRINSSNNSEQKSILFLCYATEENFQCLSLFSCTDLLCVLVGWFRFFSSFVMACVASINSPGFCMVALFGCIWGIYFLLTPTTAHQGAGVAQWLSFLLVLVPVPRVFHWDFWFSSLKKKHSISKLQFNRSGNSGWRATLWICHCKLPFNIYLLFIQKCTQLNLSTGKIVCLVWSSGWV